MFVSYEHSCELTIRGLKYKHRVFGLFTFSKTPDAPFTSVNNIPNLSGWTIPPSPPPLCVNFFCICQHLDCNSSSSSAVFAVYAMDTGHPFFSHFSYPSSVIFAIFVCLQNSYGSRICAWILKCRSFFSRVLNFNIFLYSFGKLSEHSLSQTTQRNS